MKTKVVGVTFDGRQEKIKKLFDKYGNKEFEVELVEGYYKSDKCIEVVAENLSIGFIAAKEVDQYYGKNILASFGQAGVFNGTYYVELFILVK